MDIFQGWFKDGMCADNQHVDYRSFSALYLHLRILFASVFIGIVLNIGVIISKTFMDHSWTISHHSGCLFKFLVLKPYKKNWMNHSDGLILLLFGTVMLTSRLAPKFTFILSIMIAVLVMVSVSLYFISKCVKKCCTFQGRRQVGALPDYFTQE